MRIVVVGAGRIGLSTAAAARAAGNDVVLASPATGTDAVTGDGVDGALRRADVVLDATNSPRTDVVGATRFFRTATANLLRAGTRAGVRHHVLVSFLGAARVPALGYCRAKLIQEELVRAAPMPWSVVRSTHSFEFLRTLMEANAEDGRVRLPPLWVQPLTADDLGAVLAEVTAGPPGTGTHEVAGPQALRLDELARHMTGYEVLTAPDARPFFGATVDERALLPSADARLTTTGLGAWRG